MDKTMMHIYYGYGKGKTTAAVGLAFRCANRGNKVLFSSFLKGKNSGEYIGETPFDVDDFEYCNKFWWELDEKEKNEIIDDLKHRFEVICKKADFYDMIVLDEFLDIISLGCIDKDFALEFLKKIKEKAEIVITGHDRIEEIFEMADYITQMHKEKHPFDNGMKARPGIEF